jgi:5'-nucleotidase
MDPTEERIYRSRSLDDAGSTASRSGDERLILVTNDDGFDAPGIAALIRAVEPLGRVVVAAPDREQSGTAHALTLDLPLRVFEAEKGRYRVTGTPTDCVHLAVTLLTGPRLPDLVVSGINRGLNVGDDVTYSGTVAGALEGTLLHAPSIAFSVEIDGQGRATYDDAIGLARRISREVLARGLEPGTLLNVNFPLGKPRGVRVTRQGTRTYRATAVERTDPSGQPYYWVAGAEMTPTGEPDGDHAAIREGFVSISPLQANMTHEPSMETVAGWKLETD